MLAYHYAANGDTARASCVKDWHLRAGSDSARQLAVEISIAERQDPDKYQIEGVVLGLVEKTCPASRH